MAVPVSHLAGGFLLLCLPAICRGNNSSCLQKQPVVQEGAAGRREKLKRRCGTRVGFLLCYICVFVLEKSFPAAAAAVLAAWARLLAPISPSCPGMNEWTCM